MPQRLEALHLHVHVAGVERGDPRGDVLLVHRRQRGPKVLPGISESRLFLQKAAAAAACLRRSLKDGPPRLPLEQETVGLIHAIGSVGSLLGVLLYQSVLKDYSFRSLLFWSQLLYGFSGFLDLALVLRLNLKVGVPDIFFIVVDESVSQMIGRIKWMPLLVLSSKLCPPGIEGTFFALLMSIDNIGLLSSSWGGGLLLHLLKVTRTEFSNLGAAILIRNVMRILPLAFLYLVPNTNQSSTLLPSDILKEDDSAEGRGGDDDLVELVSLVDHPRGS